MNLLTDEIKKILLTEFRKAKHRVIFLDYDGTLVPFSTIPEQAVPGLKTMAQLKALCASPQNTVAIISGRDMHFLERWFGGLPISLVAEHGAFMRTPGQEWVCSVIDTDQTWKKRIREVLQRYVDLCTGAFIEEKVFSLAWHYRAVPLEIQEIEVNELIKGLQAIELCKNRLDILRGDKIIEIKRTGYDKGLAAMKFITTHKYDFVLAIGDDRTDEDIFRKLPSDAVTIKIGTNKSLAKYTMADQSNIDLFIDSIIDTDSDKK